MNIPLAIVLAVIASVCFAVGATSQHLGVKRNFAAEGTSETSMTFKRLLKLLVTPLWVGGLALVGTGAAIHIVALAIAPITVIQPVGILAVPFSILLANRIHHTKTTGVMWGGVAITVIGIVVFTVMSALTAVPHREAHNDMVFGSGLVIWACAGVLALLAWRGPKWMHCLAWAWSGAFLYGLGSGFIKLLTIHIDNMGHPQFWGSAIGLAVSYAVGGWMIQQAYASGPAEVVVGCMTTVDPVVAVVFGLIVLDEGRAITWPYALGMAVAALMAAYGVFVLSKYHPDARKHQQHEQVAPATTPGGAENS